MAICGKIFSEQSWDCDNKPTGGIDQEIILINKSDINLTTTVLDRTLTDSAGTHKVTTLELKSGATGYSFSSIRSKRLFSVGASININDDGPNDWTHTLNTRVFNLCEESLVFLKGLGEGAEVVAVVQTNDKGTDSACAFQVYGFDKGLKLTEATYNSNENKGTIPLVLASAAPDFEPYPPMLYLDTDYATTLAAFEAKFSQP